MTHTGDLRALVAELIGPAVGEGVRRVLGVSSLERDRAATAVAADRILAAVHADIAARALSDEVQITVGDSFELTLECVDLYDESDPTSPCEHLHAIQDPYEVVRNITTALFRALGITESEAE